MTTVMYASTQESHSSLAHTVDAHLCAQNDRGPSIAKRLSTVHRRGERRLHSLGHPTRGPSLRNGQKSDSVQRAASDETAALDPNDLLCWLQVLKALESLHASGTVHGDVRPDKIAWFATEFTCKFADVDTFRIVGQEMTLTENELTHSSPEIIQSSERQACIQPEPSVDMWSLGVLAHELLTGESHPPVSIRTAPSLQEGVSTGTIRRRST